LSPVSLYKGFFFPSLQAEPASVFPRHSSIGFMLFLCSLYLRPFLLFSFLMFVLSYPHFTCISCL
jgi:hypothetical protein